MLPKAESCCSVGTVSIGGTVILNNWLGSYDIWKVCSPKSRFALQVSTVLHVLPEYYLHQVHKLHHYEELQIRIKKDTPSAIVHHCGQIRKRQFKEGKVWFCSWFQRSQSKSSCAPAKVEHDGGDQGRVARTQNNNCTMTSIFQCFPYCRHPGSHWQFPNLKLTWAFWELFVSNHNRWKKIKFKEPLQAFLFNLSMTFWQTSQNGMNEQNLTESAYPCWLEEAHRDLYLDRLGLVLIQQARQAVCTCSREQVSASQGRFAGSFPGRHPGQ